MADDYPYPDKPKLLSTDPDPVPDPEPTSPFPESLNKQKIIPIQTIIRKVGSPTNFNSGGFGYKIGFELRRFLVAINVTLPAQTFTAGYKLGFSSSYGAEFGYKIGFQTNLIYLLSIGYKVGFTSELAAPSTEGYQYISGYKLEYSDYTDRVNGYNLTAVGSPGYASYGGNVVEFTQGNYLESTNSALSAGTANFRVSCYYQYYTASTPETDFTIVEQAPLWSLKYILSTTSFVFSVKTSDGASGFVETQITSTGTEGVDNIFDLECTQDQVKITLNGTTDSVSFSNGRYSAGFTAFRICPDLPTSADVLVGTLTYHKSTSTPYTLLGDWALDANTWLDTSGNSHTLTEVGTVPIVSGMAEFDGTSSYLECIYTTLQVESKSHKITFDLYVDSVSYSSSSIYGLIHQSNAFSVAIDNNKIRYVVTTEQFGSPYTEAFTSVTSITTDVMMEIEVETDGRYAYIRIDGFEERFDLQEMLFDHGDNYLYVGYDNSVYAPPSSRIGNLKYYRGT